MLVNRKSGPATAGWAVIALSVLALTLGGCGRKGGLDAPPGALGASGEPANAAPAPGEQDSLGSKSSSLFNSGGDTSPTAPKGSKNKPFALDPLLNSQ